MYNDQWLIPDWRSAPLAGIRDGVGRGLIKLAKDSENLVVLTADLAESVRVREFADQYPERFFDVGVAEQNMMGVAAGLSFEGFVAYVASYATFSPGRNWEQIRVSVALSRANVKIIGAHGGVATGVNGPSHQATEDIALMRVLPNMKVIVPCDATSCEAAMLAAYKEEGPVYIRTTRPDTPNFTKPEKFEIGKAYVLRKGKDITIAACGIQVWDCLMVADELVKEGIECEVINVSSIKPLDIETLTTSVSKTGKLLTIEDHQIAGGMGSAILEGLASDLPKKIKMMGIKDKFGMSGSYESLYREFGLDRESLKKAVIDYLHE